MLSNAVLYVSGFWASAELFGRFIEVANRLHYATLSGLQMSTVESRRWRPDLRMLFPGTAGVSPASNASRVCRYIAGETPAVPGKSAPGLGHNRVEQMMSKVVLSALTVLLMFSFAAFAQEVDR